MPRPFFRKTSLPRTRNSRARFISMSRSSDSRFTEYALPSRVAPVTDFRPERFSTHTAAVPFVIHTRFTILSGRFIAQRSTHVSAATIVPYYSKKSMTLLCNTKIFLFASYFRYFICSFKYSAFSSLVAVICSRHTNSSPASRENISSIRLEQKGLCVSIWKI